MTNLTPTETKARLKSLGLFGLLACHGVGRGFHR